MVCVGSCDCLCRTVAVHRTVQLQVVSYVAILYVLVEKLVTLHGGVARNNPFLVEPVLLEPIPQTPFPFDLSCVRLFLKRPSHLGASCFNPFPKRPSRFSPLPKRPSHFNSYRLNPFDCFRKCVTVFESVPQNLHPGNGPCNTVKTSMQQFSVRKRTADISGQ